MERKIAFGNFRQPHSASESHPVGSKHLRPLLVMFSFAWAVAFGLAPPVWAQHLEPLGKYLNADGTLRVPPGFSGSLDPKGWTMLAAGKGAPRFTSRLNDVNSVPEDTAWDDQFCVLNFLSGGVEAIAVSGSDVYIGVPTIAIGGDTANFIIKWNGRGWSALGSGLNGGVTAIATNGSDVYVGGSFTLAGGVPANHIAKWDGSSWSALGSGTSDIVYALALSGSTVYAGGSFVFAGDTTVFYIAKWDGTAWSPLGSGMDNWVMAITVQDTDVYAGGYFVHAGGDSVYYVARWDGNNWLPLGLGVNGPVLSLKFQGTDLCAGGFFTGYRQKILSTIAIVSANHVAKWNGNWAAIGTGTNDIVYTLALQDSNLFAGGRFDSAGGTRANGIAKWDGTGWSALGSGVGGQFPYVYTLAFSGTDLYAGGNFATAGEDSAGRVARWDGSSWSALGNGLNGPIYSLVVIGNNVYAGGTFTLAGGVTVHNIARWDGTIWSPLGIGTDGVVFALAASGTDLYAGGDFTHAGGVNTNYIAKWDGNSWSALGSGMNNQVRTLTASGTDLYAGGPFTNAGGTPANQIARWDGFAWSALGAGLTGSYRVQTLAAAPNGSGGTDVYAGGQFDTIGGVPAKNIAKWNGGHWAPLASGVNSNVLSLVTGADSASGIELYAGGYLYILDSVNAYHVAKWNGSGWSALGSGIGDYFVSSLALNGTDLYAAGTFTTAGAATANNIAKWDGNSWWPLGSGIVANGVVCLTSTGNAIYVGGYLYNAGGKPSSYIARWKLPPPPEPISVTLASGWNLLSLPDSPSDDSVSFLYPEAVTNAFAYVAGGYQIQPIVTPGIGYWLRFSSPPAVSITGIPLSRDTISVTQGWNLIGSISQPVRTSSITSNPPGLITSNFFGFNGGYVIADSIDPGHGYWVKVNTGGQLILTASGAINPASHIRIIPDQELPPSPPDRGAVSSAGPPLPHQFALEQNYPNPFNPSTFVRFKVPVTGFVSLRVYDLLGREVVTLVNEMKKPGEYSVEWDARAVPSGVYFYQMVAGEFKQTLKLVVIK